MISMTSEHILILSILIIFCYGVAYKMANKYKHPDISKSITFLATMALIATIIMLMIDAPMHMIKFNYIFVKDYTSCFVEFVTLCLALAIILTTTTYNKKENIPQFEYIILVLCITAAIHLLVTVEDIFALYLILEFQNICMCVLIAIRKGENYIDAAIKSLIAGSIASAALLAGFATMYDISGGMSNFEELSIFFSNVNAEATSNWVLYVSIILISIGLFMKMYISPFHIWISDIYSYAPNSSLLMLATTSTMPIFVLSHKIYVGILSEYSWFWGYIICITCVASIVIGTIGAIYQNSIKGILAYSSIANAGYIFLVLLSYDSIEAVSNGLMYLTIYIFNIYGLLSMMTNIRFNAADGTEYTLETIEQLSGLYHRNRWLSTMISLYAFTLAGLPPFSFFFSKMGIFMSVLDNFSYVWLASIMAIATTVAAFYYMRIVQLMFFEETDDNNVIQKIPFFVLLLSYTIITVNIIFYIYSTEITAIILLATYDLYT